MIYPSSLPRWLASRRRPHVLIFLIALPFLYALLKISHYALGFYSSGHFVQYHMEMTPAFMMEDAPIKSIPVKELGYTAVVLYMISASRLRELILSLSYLYQNVPMQPWPIILFYADDMEDPSLRTEFTLRLYDFLGGGQDVRWFVSRIEFERLEWALPPGVSNNKVDVDPVFIDAWPGYHLMCHFFATQIFDHPRLRDVTYYLRLDTDSYIYKPLCYDPLELFHARNRTYGYRTRSNDPGWVTIGMWKLTWDFVRSRPEVAGNLEKNNWTWPSSWEPRNLLDEPYPTYYNNFEIVRLDAFRRPDIREWLDEIQRDPMHIYKYRWGDAPIRFATVNMYLDPEKDVEEYCGMHYWHNGIQGPNCACEDQKRGRRFLSSGFRPRSCGVCNRLRCHQRHDLQCLPQFDWKVKCRE